MAEKEYFLLRGVVMLLWQQLQATNLFIYLFLTTWVQVIFCWAHYS